MSRDFLEPSTASIVSGNLGLSDMCQNFDVANACLAFLNGMDIASRMIERGEIDYALVVDGQRKVERRQLQTGPNSGIDIVVTSGLKEGDKVIVEGIQKVRAGIVVQETVLAPASR